MPKMPTIVLRVVGGPHDGATIDVAANAGLVQLAEGHRVRMGDWTLSERVIKNTAQLYTRRKFVFADGKEVHFLAWSKWTDRQALCHLLKIPYEEG